MLQRKKIFLATVATTTSVHEKNYFLWYLVTTPEIALKLYKIGNVRGIKFKDLFVNNRLKKKRDLCFCLHCNWRRGRKSRNGRSRKKIFDFDDEP